MENYSYLPTPPIGGVLFAQDQVLIGLMGGAA